MSSLLFLSTDDFRITHGKSGDVISHQIKGFSLILYYSTKCVYCQQIIPIFKQLPYVVNGCQFGIINVSLNKSLISMASRTITPIEYVPLIILYINGSPYMRYNGPNKQDDIRNFIIEVSNKVQEQGFSSTLKENNIPEYTIGIPKCDDEVCYLEFDEESGYHKK